MEAGALNHTTAVLPGLTGRSPLLRLKSDDQLIELNRRGQHGAFEALVQRYQSRLLAFCRHMLNSTEDAEDVLQEVFAAAFNAMIADARAINARPWLYRIARNRCLNHLRRPTSAGQDSMDVFERDGGATTADTVHKREEFRQIVADVQELPETQRTALLLRANKALAAVYPLGPLVLVKKFLAAKLSFGAGATGASTAGGSSSGAGFAGGAAAAAGGAAGSAGAGGVLSAGFGTVASKAVAGFAAPAIVTAGAGEARHVVDPQPTKRPAVAAVSPAPVPVAPAPLPLRAIEHPQALAAVPHLKDQPAAKAAAKPVATAQAATTQAAAATAPAPAPTPATATTTTSAPTQQQTGTGSSTDTQHQQTQPATQESGSTVVLDGGDNGSGSASGSGSTGGGDGS